MRFLLIPLCFDLHKEQPLLFTDMLSAFKKQGEAMIFTTMDEAIDFKPDVIFYQGSLTKEQCVLLKTITNAYWTTWTGDMRYAPMESLMECREFTDKLLLPFTGELLHTYTLLLGKPCDFIYEPLHEWRMIEPKEMEGGKVSFVGNIYNTVPGGEMRKELKEFIKENVPDYEFHNGSIAVNDVPKLYNDSYLVIAQNNFHDTQNYFTPRNLLAMGAGSCCLAKVFPGIEQRFKNYKHCVYYRHKYELLDAIIFLRNHPEVRNKIAKQGYELAKNYTYSQWVKDYIKLLEI
jgi:hypothetical protein